MANQLQLQKFTGQGIVFPIILNSMGRPDLVFGKDLIKASIRTLLAWPYATRFFLYEYGVRLEELLEEPNDSITKNLARHFIIDSITKFEKRVTLLAVTVIDTSDSSISIDIKYSIINNQTQDNFIYPFYRKIIY